VQNRVAIASPRLPQQVQQIGVVVAKSSPDILMVVNLYSPDKSRDQLFITNYANNSIKGGLTRLDGVGSITVFGARVGDAVAQWVRDVKRADVNPLQAEAVQHDADHFLSSQAGESPFKLRDELGDVMWEQVGIVRDGAGLQAAIDQIKALQSRAARLRTPGGRRFNLAWQQALDVRNLLLASELIARGALVRTESRGAHYRSDYPQTDNARWLKNIYLSRDGDATRWWTEDVQFTRLKLST